MQGVVLFPQTRMSVVIQEVMAAAKDDRNGKKGYILLFHLGMFLFFPQQSNVGQFTTVQSL